MMILSVLVTASIGGVAVAQSQDVYADGNPDINVYTPDNEVIPGSTTDFTIQLDNEDKLDAGKEANREYVTTDHSYHEPEVDRYAH